MTKKTWKFLANVIIKMDMDIIIKVLLYVNIELNMMYLLAFYFSSLSLSWFLYVTCKHLLGLERRGIKPTFLSTSMDNQNIQNS